MIRDAFNGCFTIDCTPSSNKQFLNSLTGILLLPDVLVKELIRPKVGRNIRNFVKNKNKKLKKYRTEENTDKFRQIFTS